MGYGPIGMELPWPLTDGRVTVRPADPADAHAFLGYKRRPECQAYVSRTVDTLEQAQALIGDRIGEADSLLCAVLLADRVVGDIGGRRYRPETLGPEPDVHDFYLGYSIDPDYWNRGVASAATALVVTALHEAGIRRVVAKTFAENAASIRVLTKNGFVLEGTERFAALGRDGRWLDDCTLAHLVG
ncbi:GNAT family N-acetyltransferase [Intrasporangium calvum]|uniref:GNAT family N-acetyltransferase n=1 Tax=Intrasporangium calvum TaxID=53358 RepID=A0ABT5GMC2_9MICO|nr:GNAT family N-acetyltransferase [Intrasporangium calvum]MDC5699336.1 GNAT family N-acetyltransferase [Intrasporangium calvum]